MDPQRFVDHFTSNGWKVSGKTKMVDWQAAVRNWAGNEFPKSGVSRRGAIASGPGQRLHVAGKAVADDAF
ncbi:MAG: hypothetical protein SH850_07990 [Planctomycetaceae bacterium]|nr:hypothetical protein [Planctomycetaceae bacterium]